MEQIRECADDMVGGEEGEVGDVTGDELDWDDDELGVAVSVWCWGPELLAWALQVDQVGLALLHHAGLCAAVRGGGGRGGA